MSKMKDETSEERPTTWPDREPDLTLDMQEDGTFFRVLWIKEELQSNIRIDRGEEGKMVYDTTIFSFKVEGTTVRWNFKDNRKRKAWQQYGRRQQAVIVEALANHAIDNILLEKDNE